jgi:hypothetical protein
MLVTHLTEKVNHYNASLAVIVAVFKLKAELDLCTLSRADVRCFLALTLLAGTDVICTTVQDADFSTTD